MNKSLNYFVFVIFCSIDRIFMNSQLLQLFNKQQYQIYDSEFTIYKKHTYRINVYLIFNQQCISTRKQQQPNQFSSM